MDCYFLQLGHFCFVFVLISFSCILFTLVFLLYLLMWVYITPPLSLLACLCVFLHHSRHDSFYLFIYFYLNCITFFRIILCDD